MTKRTVTRSARFDGTVGTDGKRRTQVGDKKKVHGVVVEGMIAKIVLPKGYTDREVPARKGQAALPYQEFQFELTDHRQSGRRSYLLINSFLGQEAAGTQVTAKMKVGLKSIFEKGREFHVYYLKLDPTNESPTHEVQVAQNDLVNQNGLDAGAVRHELGMDPEVAKRKFLFCDASMLNPNMEGGIFLVPIGKLNELAAATRS